MGTFKVTAARATDTGDRFALNRILLVFKNAEVERDFNAPLVPRIRSISFASI